MTTTKRKRRSFINMGLCRHEHWLVWGYKHGFMLNWPMWTKRPIVKAWNSMACMMYGHDDIEVQLYKDPELRFSRPPCCVNCGTELPVDGVYVRRKSC